MRYCEMHPQLSDTILVILGIEFTYGRSLLSGILEQVRMVPGLRVQLVRNPAELKENLGKARRFRAAIGMIWDRRSVDQLKRKCDRVISFANKPPYSADCHVILKDAAIGELAARTFLKMDLRDCAVFLPELHFHFNERFNGFARICKQEQVRAPDQLRTLEAAVGWIRQAESPAGVFAVNDVHARSLVQRFEEAGHAIPGRVSILGVDDDDVYVHLGGRSLSSIHLPFREMGRRAVELVASGSGPELLEMEPTAVVHRDTTIVGARLPTLLKRYMEFLRKERPLPGSVDAACRRSGIPRRSLELACRQSLNSSPGLLLREERLKVARLCRERGMGPGLTAQEMGYLQTRSAKRLLEQVL